MFGVERRGKRNVECRSKVKGSLVKGWKEMRGVGATDRILGKGKEYLV